MGQKVNPHGLRVGIIKDWDSIWYAEKDFSKFILEDYNIRKFLDKELDKASVSRIVIKRTSDKVKVYLYTATPGMVIGRSGQAIVELTKKVKQFTEKEVDINIMEIKRRELDAKLVAEDIAQQLEERVTFRRAMKQAMTRTMKMGAKGIKTAVSGRLGGADIARTEHYHEGTIPLQTLRADIDYGFAEADTTYGKLGVKVWIYKGEILPGRTKADEPTEVKEFKEPKENKGERGGNRGNRNRNYGNRGNNNRGNRDNHGNNENRPPRREEGAHNNANAKEGQKA
ncbi:MAG: 30S ribosomal protein S3 [Turicibacter sp.]|nr:30S ribosomal protein S3 [Turicibacter sp.]